MATYKKEDMKMKFVDFALNGMKSLLLFLCGQLVRMSVSGYRAWRFEPRHQYVVSLSKTLYPHCFN